MSEESNVISSTVAKRWAGEILASLAKTDDIRATYRDKMKPELEFESEHRQGLYEAAEAAGLPLNSLKLEIARRRDIMKAEQKIAEREDAAGDDIVELADQIKEVLGADFAGFGLGAAAVKAAGEKPKKEAKPKKAAKGGALVGGDNGGKPKTGADVISDDIRSTRQKEKEEIRKAEAEERLAGIKPTDGGLQH